MGKRIFVFTVCALAVVGVAAFAAGGKESAAKGPITVGSKIDTEGGLLGQMIVQMLRANGFTVVDKTQFGTTDVVRKAIIAGDIDLYPEYTGNGAFFFSGTDPQVWHDAARGYDLVKQLDQQRNGLVWLQPASANNTWAIAVRADLAKSANLASLGDLARYVASGATVKLAASEEFASRPDGLAAIEEAYGFKLAEASMVLFSGGNTAATEKAAADGTDGVNTAMAYGTDGSLAALGLVVLTDPKGVEPVYEPAPLVRQPVLEKYPEIQKILEPVFSSLDLVALQTLNGDISIKGEDAATVAKQYLVEKGFLKG